MSPGQELRPIHGTHFCYDVALVDALARLKSQVLDLRSTGALSVDVLADLRRFFRVKNIYHSNAIEGNVLSLGETRIVVEEGLTISGKPLRDSLEAKNLSHAMDYFERLAQSDGGPIRGTDVRGLHSSILKGIDDRSAGTYRTEPVEITGSGYRPTPPESVPSEMEAFLGWLAQATTPDGLADDPVLLAAAAHTWFVFIHPFADGNGRTARLLMNLILMRHGYPIAVISRDDRERYYEALEDAQGSDLSAFIQLVGESVEESLEEYNRAVKEDREKAEWARSIVGALGEREEVRAKNRYEVWHSAMILLKGYFRQTVELLSEEASRTGLSKVFFMEFGELEFERYLAVRSGAPVKRTWFFRIDFRSGDRSARYLFWFTRASAKLQKAMDEPDVTLMVSRETTPYFYDRVDRLDRSDVPDLAEIGYLANEERFVARYRNDATTKTRVEELGRAFIEQVCQRSF